MEYLMTYGWAILVILVVLGILYLLGIFSGGSILGTQCNAIFNYLCTSPAMATNGTISFIAGQNTEVPEYNVAFACTASANSTSGGPFTNGVTPWYYVNASLNLAQVYNASDSYTLQSSDKVLISNLPCFGTQGNLLSAGGPLHIGTSFTGDLWMRYTSNAGAENEATNKWITVEFATATVPVTVNSTNSYHGSTTIGGSTTAASGTGSTTAATTATTTTVSALL